MSDRNNHFHDTKEMVQTMSDMRSYSRCPTCGQVSAGKEKCVDKLVEALRKVKITMNHARVFITSRQKMHPTGVVLWDEEVKEVDEALKGVE